MTDEIEILEFALGLVAEIEEVFAISNAIAGGLVTDSETIMNTAARASKILEASLIGHRLMLREGYDEDSARIMQTIYKNE